MVMKPVHLVRLELSTMTRVLMLQFVRTASQDIFRLLELHNACLAKEGPTHPILMARDVCYAPKVITPHQDLQHAQFAPRGKLQVLLVSTNASRAPMVSLQVIISLAMPVNQDFMVSGQFAILVQITHTVIRVE